MRNRENIGMLVPIIDGGEQCQPIPNPISIADLGTATLTPSGDFAAGSYQTFTLVYTAGKYGIDDSGALRVCFRFAADQSRPQADDPTWRNYVTATASNNAVLDVRYDPKGNVRPWDRTLEIKVVRGFLRQGDTITITFGDRSQGSPGMRLQTFCEDTMEFRVLVDPIATYTFQALPEQPMIRIVPGDPVRWIALAPTLVRKGEAFLLSLKCEDEWGNPSDRVDATVRLRTDVAVAGLPETVIFKPGERAEIIEGLSVTMPGDVAIEVLDEAGDVLTRANPLRVVDGAELVHFWGDMHGQSEETIGTNSARAYFEFARDLAFLDATAHQGNDFQLTNAFYRELDRLTAEFNEPGRFVTLPGYEWSGNTALGGDRNVYFASEGAQIRRSSHALVADISDVDTNANTAQALFKAFAAHDEDVVCYAHCGGRYADVKMAHDGRFERSMEIHSAWGTFEWLLQDALEMGYRVGVVANSDGHKGRPGASYPGASQFGAIGGLTCFLMPELSREALLTCMRQRRHYGTTGARLIVDVVAEFEQSGTLYHDDPALGPAEGIEATAALMGDIVHLPAGGMTLRVDVRGSAPIERVDLYNGLRHVETIRPFAQEELGRRIRVLWEGAEYRGRFRQVIWDGTATFSENTVERALPINFFNLDKKLTQTSENTLEWQALTTGNFGGFDAWMRDPYGGTLKLETPLISCGVPLEEIGLDDEIIDNSGVLPRFIRLFRLPDENVHTAVTFTREVALGDDGDNAVFVKVTQEDGHVAWTSPIYVYR